MDIDTTIDTPLGEMLLAGDGSALTRVSFDVDPPRDSIRAVGAAVGANPLLIVRPCHRVVGADGTLTGYAGGVERKHGLLTLEGALQPRLWSAAS
ncbi:methylated-DNA--[protein]-cysteine S-methyltransferase [Nonomuraea sp. B19D2]|uniref:methylated-DNA--[protein]-cysteine S-methyltransferase n=1 Tax=Nonomuraea sp. B19D2 TaxID=3159561 RepID=UPI0032DAD9F2